MSNLDTPQVIEEQEINNPNEIQKNLSLEYLKFILKEIKISSTSKNYYKIEIPNDYFMPKHPVYLNYIIPKNS